MIPALLAIHVLSIRDAHHDMRLTRPLAIGFGALLVVASSLAMVSELRIGPFRRALLQRWASMISTYRVQPDAALRTPHFYPSTIRERCRALARLRLSVFSR